MCSKRQALIIMRNENIRLGIRRKYKTITSDPLPLPFFAVSSLDYNAQASGFMADEEFPLPVDTTGIPALRRHCYQVPAKSRLDALTHYREGILTELISSLDLWSSQYKVQRRSELKKIVTKPSMVGQLLVKLFLSSTDASFTGDTSHHRKMCLRNQRFGRKLRCGEVQCINMGPNLLPQYTNWYLGELQDSWIRQNIRKLKEWTKVSVFASNVESL